MNGNRIWVLVTTVAIAAILGLGWLLGVSPLLAQAETAETERAAVELTNASQQAALLQMQDQFEQLDDLEVALEELRLSIPGETDADGVYALLAAYRDVAGASPALITLGEAVQYGVPVDAGTTASPAPGSAPPATGRLATDLYSVPITVTFEGTSLDAVYAFVYLMQHGPRLFLVSSVTTSPEGSTITAHVFVIHDGATSVVVPEGATVPEPAPTESATPTPDPSGTPTPEVTPTP